MLDRGIYSFAPHPPLDDTFLTSRLWDRFLPDWRKRMTREPKRSAESEAELMDQLRRMDGAQRDESGEQFDTDSARFLSVSRYLPIRRGKWRLISREAEEAHNKSST